MLLAQISATNTGFSLDYVLGQAEFNFNTEDFYFPKRIEDSTICDEIKNFLLLKGYNFDRLDIRETRENAYKVFLLDEKELYDVRTFVSFLQCMFPRLRWVSIFNKVVGTAGQAWTIELVPSSEKYVITLKLCANSMEWEEETLEKTCITLKSILDGLK